MGVYGGVAVEVHPREKQRMRHYRFVVLLALVLSMHAATSLAPRAASAAQDPLVGEASLDLDRANRRLIQQELRNAGFDPGTPDGLFGPRTRAAIRDWQQARGASPTGYLMAAEAELLLTGTAPPAASGTPPTTQAIPAVASVPQADFNPVTRHHPQPDPAPAAAATAPAQLPPPILLDSALLRAEESVRTDDRPGALAAMDHIDALQAAHELVPPPDYHYRFARVWSAVTNWERSQAAAVRYLELTGRDGDHYLDALTLMNQATAGIEQLERARELQAAEEARARAEEARARAARARALRAAADVIAEMQFVSIAPGRFRMGSSNDASFFRRPRTQVRLTRSFDIARYEITEWQWTAVLGNSTSIYSQCAQCPVLTYSWDDVQSFIRILNTAGGGDRWTYRLPTEAEWEYAARAGREGDRLGWELNESAWVLDNSGGRTHPVGLKEPNGFGLYDMFGNADELTGDWFGLYPGGTVTDPTGHVSGIYRLEDLWHLSGYLRGRRGTSMPEKVVRGCSWLSSRRHCEWSDRGTFVGEAAPVGLRLVRVAR